MNLKMSLADDLQILVQIVIAWKPEFWANPNEWLKHQDSHKLQDQYYAAISHSLLQMLDSKESFTQFWGCLVMTFSGRRTLRKISSNTSVVEVSLSGISEEAEEPKLTKNSQQRQNQINQQAMCISSLGAQNQKLSQLLEPKFLVNAITTTVAGNLNIGQNNMPSSSSSWSGYTGEPYVGKPHSSQFAAGVDGFWTCS